MELDALEISSIIRTWSKYEPPIPEKIDCQI